MSLRCLLRLTWSDWHHEPLREPGRQDAEPTRLTRNGSRGQANADWLFFANFFRGKPCEAAVFAERLSFNLLVLLPRSISAIAHFVANRGALPLIRQSWRKETIFGGFPDKRKSLPTSSQRAFVLTSVRDVVLRSQTRSGLHRITGCPQVCSMTTLAWRLEYICLSAPRLRGTRLLPASRSMKPCQSHRSSSH
jgi:hypothetical protein